MSNPGIQHDFASSRDANPRSQHDDDRLLRDWCAGDLDAGDELARRYYQPICRFLFNRAGCSSDAVREVAHEVFVTVAQRKADIRRFRPFLYGVAGLKLLEYRRTRVTEPIAEGRVVDQDESRGASALIDARDSASREDIAARALRSLPMGDQIVLALKNVKDLTRREVADILGVCETTVAKRIAAARERLRVAIAGLERPDAATREDTRPRRLSSWAESIGDTLVALRCAHLRRESPV